MNIQNVVELARRMELLGFSEASSLLLKRICFNPDSFYLPQVIAKEEATIMFSLYFEKSKNDGSYALKYYDATLQKDNNISLIQLDAINTIELEKQMAAVDWKKAFDLNADQPFNAADKSTWEAAARIESVIDTLKLLEKDQQGKIVSTALKIKFWTGTLYHEMFRSTATVKSKSDISQRFYVSDSGNGITVDEAFRFLENKSLEKQMQQRKKHSTDEIETVNTSSHNGLFKKRQPSSRKLKIRKANTD